MSWKPEVIADNSGKFCGNALRFATEAEARDSVNDLACRWMLVRETRVVESNDPVNYRRVNGRDVAIPDYGKAMTIVTASVKRLGYDRINPESLTALRVALDDGEFTDDEEESRKAMDAYTTVIQGFIEMLAPKESV